jgi:hypothetical protein
MRYASPPALLAGVAVRKIVLKMETAKARKRFRAFAAVCAETHSQATIMIIACVPAS